MRRVAFATTLTPARIRGSRCSKDQVFRPVRSIKSGLAHSPDRRTTSASEAERKSMSQDGADCDATYPSCVDSTATAEKSKILRRHSESTVPFQPSFAGLAFYPFPPGLGPGPAVNRRLLSESELWPPPAGRHASGCGLAHVPPCFGACQGLSRVRGARCWPVKPCAAAQVAATRPRRARCSRHARCWACRRIPQHRASRGAGPRRLPRRGSWRGVCAPCCVRRGPTAQACRRNASATPAVRGLCRAGLRERGLPWAQGRAVCRL